MSELAKAIANLLRQYEGTNDIEHLASQIAGLLRTFQKPEHDQPAAVPDIKTMVDRFLGWKLPEDFAPDCGIKFQPLDYNGTRSHPIGTNLLTADQAKAMFEFVLAALPKQPAADKDCDRCRGKGWNWLAGAPAHETNKYPCEKCSGTGKVLDQTAAGQSEPVAEVGTIEWRLRNAEKLADEWKRRYEGIAVLHSNKCRMIENGELVYADPIPAAPAVPDGWIMVPLEPDAGTLSHVEGISDSVALAQYKRIISVASIQGASLVINSWACSQECEGLARCNQWCRNPAMCMASYQITHRPSISAASPNQQGGAEQTNATIEALGSGKV